MPALHDAKYERWLQRWTEHLRQIRSTVGAANVPATRCAV
jgi:hypothetical protein